MHYCFLVVLQVQTTGTTGTKGLRNAMKSLILLIHDVLIALNQHCICMQACELCTRLEF